MFGAFVFLLAPLSTPPLLLVVEVRGWSSLRRIEAAMDEPNICNGFDKHPFLSKDDRCKMVVSGSLGC